MSTPDSSPPPYSPIPLAPTCTAPISRASSSPYLRPPRPRQFHTYSSSPSSSALAVPLATPPSYSQSNLNANSSDEEPDETLSDDGMIYAVPTSVMAHALRSRLLKRKRRASEGTLSQPIATTAGLHGPGETETESEDSLNHLYTARSARLTFPALPNWFIPFLITFSRFLSVVPAVFGTLWNIYHIIWPPGGPGARSLEWRIDFFVSTLWSILTGWQCLQLTTGLLKRWWVYYSLAPTLIRLFALQAICWPATHLTLTLLNHEKRPALCWAVIGTTTCYSRSIQLWVTSNIASAPAPAGRPTSHPAASARSSVLWTAGGMREEWMRLRRRRWDWAAVGSKCVLPAAVVYFVMAWADMLRREWERPLC